MWYSNITKYWHMVFSSKLSCIVCSILGPIKTPTHSLNTSTIVSQKLNEYDHKNFYHIVICYDAGVFYPSAELVYTDTPTVAYTITSTENNKDGSIFTHMLQRHARCSDTLLE